MWGSAVLVEKEVREAEKDREISRNKTVRTGFPDSKGLKDVAITVR